MVLDEVLENVFCMIQVLRWCLYVFVIFKGCIVGNLCFYDVDGNYVDCSYIKVGI